MENIHSKPSLAFYRTNDTVAHFLIRKPTAFVWSFEMWHLPTEYVWPYSEFWDILFYSFSNSLLCPSPFPLCCHWMTRTTFSSYNILGPHSHQSVCSHSISNPFWWVIYQLCLSWREPNPRLCCFIQLWLKKHSSGINLLSNLHCNHCTIILKVLH